MALESNHVEMRKKTFVLAAVLSVSAIAGNAGAEEVMTLQQCRDSAIANNFNLKIARKQMEMAEHDRKTAMANYFPDISVSGAYMYNSRSIDLLSQETSDALSGMGTSAQENSKDTFSDTKTVSLQRRTSSCAILSTKRKSFPIRFSGT